MSSVLLTRAIRRGADTHSSSCPSIRADHFKTEGRNSLPLSHGSVYSPISATAWPMSIVRRWFTGISNPPIFFSMQAVPLSEISASAFGSLTGWWTRTRLRLLQRCFFCANGNNKPVGTPTTIERRTARPDQNVLTSYHPSIWNEMELQTNNSTGQAFAGRGADQPVPLNLICNCRGSIQQFRLGSRSRSPKTLEALASVYFASGGKVVYVCASPAGMRIPNAPI